MNHMLPLRIALLLAALILLASVATCQAAPEINNRAGAANVAPGEAKLQGRLDGGGDADVVVFYGPTDGGTTAGDWAHKLELKNVKNGAEFSATADRLTFGQTYYYRCRAANAGGETWAGASSRFTTLKPRVPAPEANRLPVQAGLVCWFDAAVGVTTDNQGVVRAWRDRSGHAHDGTLAAGTPLLVQDEIGGRPAVQFRTGTSACGLNLDGPFFTQQQFVVVRSPNAQWNKDGCFLGRRWRRNSSYRLSAKSTKFWGDQYPQAVSKNGKRLPEPPFDLGSITETMILKIDVNDGDMSRSTYQINMADLASCDCDIAEIIGYQTTLSPSDEELVGGYLAAKYGIKTDYPANAGLVSANVLTNAPAAISAPDAAILSATLNCPGSLYEVRVYWGTTDGGTDANLWENSAPVDAWTDAAGAKIRHALTGLTPGATYYFTFRGTNAVDSLWADKSLSFRLGNAAAGSSAPELRVKKGLVCWFDAAVGVTADDQGAVRAWKDLSGRNHHAATGGGTAPVLAANGLLRGTGSELTAAQPREDRRGEVPVPLLQQAAIQSNLQSAVQFRKGWLALEGTFFAKEHYLVLRSPTAKWSGAAGLLGRLKGRGSSYNTWGSDTGFWQDQEPAAVSRNGTVLPGPAFDCSPLGKFMLLKIIVNDQNSTEAAYAIGNNDGLAACDFDIAEILGYESLLGPADEALVGGYLAAKYGLDTAYPPLPPAGPKPELPAAETAAVKYQGWQHSGSLFLLTTPEGANLPASAVEENFPVLVRLDQDWFRFGEAKPNGEDIRFATASGAPLAYQIDTWDAAAGAASVWVRVPKIRGNSRQELKMYWGKAGAQSESSGPAVFNSSNGYLSVWHMHDPVQDEVGTVPSTDQGTAPALGRIGSGRHFSGGKGIHCGDTITKYPFASSPHTTEAWIKPERLNTTVLDWGKYNAVNLRLLSTPAHVSVGNGKSNLHAASLLKLSEWVHVVYAYDGQSDRIYVNGRLDLPASASSTLEILTPVRLQMGRGFVGDLDEVRISKVARSADWVKLQYENQKPLQSLVGPLVQPGATLAASAKQVVVQEGQPATVTVQAGGAQKVYWIIRRGDAETVVDADHFRFTVGGRVTGTQSFTLRIKAIYPDGVKTLDIPVTIQEGLPDPAFTLQAPATWDGRETIEVVPQISNLAALQAKGVGDLMIDWAVPPLVEVQEIVPGKLILKRTRNSGRLCVTATVSNGGAPVRQTVEIAVKEPTKDPWVRRTPEKDEKPVDNQFYARDDRNEGTLYYNGTLDQPADAVFLKLYADDKLIRTESQALKDDRAYALAVPLKAGLVEYKVEFGRKTAGAERVVHTASHLICGDAFLLDGQSNTVAEDWGPEKCEYSSAWIRSFGSLGGDGSAGWGSAVRRGGPRNIGYWGMDLAKHLLETQRIPVCIINGAVGGTRIDQHQRKANDPNDKDTIYGRWLTRVQQARLTHGIRAVLWHQGEADQGTDGPDSGYGWETYEQYFLKMSAAWKQDLPNLQYYYLYQIWPNACGQGGNQHSDKLRDVQRRLPRLYSNLRVMSTLGIKPEGGCHYPAAGYAEMARLMIPLVERDLYGKTFTKPVTAPDLKRASFSSVQQDELALEFDQPMVFRDALLSQFYLDGKAGQIASGAAVGNVVKLKLAAPSAAKTITYLTDRQWDSKNLLEGQNGIAALTFCEVEIAPAGKGAPQ